MGVVAKRSSMTFYSDAEDHYSHRVRIVLAEKGVTVEVINVDLDNKPSELAEINPYSSLPTLVDRELVLYEPNIMMEYLDERFPHPPLLPVYPVARAESRLWMYRIQRDWASYVDKIREGEREGDDHQAAQARMGLRNSLIETAPIFAEKPYFMSEEFTIVDCCVAPILWRIPALGIDLPEHQVQPLVKYMSRLFERDAFQASLSDAENEMRAR